MKLIAVLIATVLVAVSIKAQTIVPTDPLVSPNLIGDGYSSPTGTTPYTGTGGGFSGGSTPGYNSSTNTIYFGYTQSTVAYNYAFSQALQNSGMSILGYNYSWNYLNQGDSSGNLSATVNFAGTNGTSLHSKYWSLGPTTNWTNVSGTETFPNNGLAALNIANFSLSFNGKDSRFWAGHYGPQVKDPSLSLNYTFDQCSSNPLSSPTCPGYAAAYLNQQCTANPLYNSACPGYAAAYHIQQCTINPLNDPSCPGYAAAYLTYQCSINPLYSTTCSGYAEAYKTQQCALDGLYDRTCPNYADAYARKYVIGIPSSGTISYGPADSRCTVGCGTTTTQNPNAGPATSGYSGPGATNVSTTQPVTSISNSGQISTGVAVTNDSNVNSVIATPRMDGPAASTGNSPVASSMNSPGPAASGSSTQTANAGPATKQEQKQEERKAENKPEGGQPQGGQQGGQQEQKSDQPKTARQELQERRQEAAKAKAVEQGKDLANSMGKATDMEQQKQIQNVVIQAMGFTPGFDAYKVMIPDVAGYKPYSIYGNQRTVDNRSARRLFGGTDQLHNEMVNSQYK